MEVRATYYRYFDKIIKLLIVENSVNFCTTFTFNLWYLTVGHQGWASDCNGFYESNISSMHVNSTL